MGIENFISVAETTKPKLTADLRQHLEAYPVKVREEIRVRSIDAGEKGFVKRLALSTGEVLEANTVIVATGARWRELECLAKKRMSVEVLTYCPHCDGLLSLRAKTSRLSVGAIQS